MNKIKKLVLSKKQWIVIFLSLINLLIIMRNFHQIIFKIISWNKCRNKMYNKKILWIKVITLKKNLMKYQKKVKLMKIINLKKIFKPKMIKINLIIFEY